MGAGVVGGGDGWWQWRCEIRRSVGKSSAGASSCWRRRQRCHPRLGGRRLVPCVGCGGFSCPSLVPPPRLLPLVPLHQSHLRRLLLSLTSSMMVLVLGGLASLLCLISRNHAEFVIRVELGPHARFRSIGFLLEFLRFNDELRGEPLLSPVKLTPISTAQHHTSVLCRFRGGSRDGDYRFVKRFARLMRL
uniref:DUF3778 domain-containing protein n=1 Tax=Oryza glumipatula TaxID=40148 RepID=A0A0E0AK39_9ORYZ